MADPVLDYVHMGAFSGSALSLRDAVCDRVETRVLDLLPLSRSVTLLPSRAAAALEARRAGRGVPWAKTAAWSRALDRSYRRWSQPRPRALLLVQTVAAFTRVDVPYAVYTDRAGSEGAAVGGAFASRSSPGWRAAERRLLRGAQRVYTMGPSTREVLVSDYGLDADRVRVAAAGPNVPIGAEIASTTCRRLLFVGTQWELKGGPELLEAFTALRPRHPGLELVVAGASPPGAFPEGVSVAGRVPHARMTDLYRSADLIVVPTHMEAFGIALVEGLMMGIPCVASTIGNQGWIVGEAGRLVAPGDPVALAAAIAEVIGEYPAFRRRASERGAELRAEFSWGRIADMIVADLCAAS